MIFEGDLPGFGHNGGAPGMSTELQVYPQAETVLVVLSNLDPPASTRLANFINLRLPIR